MKGTYEYSGSFAGVKAKGSGTYVVKLDKDGGGGTMTGKGKGSITSPLGTFTGFGTEHYTLTPAFC